MNSVKYMYENYIHPHFGKLPNCDHMISCCNDFAGNCGKEMASDSGLIFPLITTIIDRQQSNLLLRSNISEDVCGTRHSNVPYFINDQIKSE